MSGSEYLETLRDDRSVYLYGERVQDVTVHPAFRNSARSLARLYDALHKEELRDVMTTVDRFGIRTHRFFAPSYSASELLAARDAIAAWARLTYGFMGRTPDYKAAFMATLGANPEIYSPFEEYARRGYGRFASRGLCRPSYEQSARSPFDQPLSSRFDENDAVLIFDGALIPWENFLVYRNVERANSFFPESGFFNRYNLQGGTRLAVKLDLMTGL